MTTHACPPEGSGVCPCCGRPAFELPMTDRLTLDSALVTCDIPKPEPLTYWHIENDRATCMPCGSEFAWPHSDRSAFDAAVHTPENPLIVRMREHQSICLARSDDIPNEEDE